MTCSACSSSIERALRRKDYIKKVDVDLILQKASIVYDEQKTDLQTIIKHIQKLGYSAEIDKKIAHKSQSQYKIAIFFAIPLFVLSMGSMFFHTHNERLLCVIEILLLLPILYAGRNIYKKGALSLIRFVPNMDSLVMLGSGSAIIYSAYMFVLNLLGDNPNLLHSVYFESAGVIIAVIMLGKNLESKATKNAKEGLESLQNLSPKTALVWKDNNTSRINIDDIPIGSMIIVPKGEMVSLDGILQDTKCRVDESLITGESKAKQKIMGDTILSGSINQGEQFRLQVIALAKDSMIGKIINLMQGIKKAPIARIADTLSSYFVPFIIALATIGALVWFALKGDVHLSFIIFTSTLLISCPCALGLATPLSMLIATNRASKNAIYFKSSESLEEASKIDIMIFDKTGTLTDGNFEVIDVNLQSDLPKEYIFGLINAIEKESEHLIARAITNYIAKIPQIPQNLQANEVQTFVGEGISGIVENKRIKIGSPKFIGVDSTHIAESQYTIVYFSLDDTILGSLSIADNLRGNAKELVSKLSSLHIQSIIVSGDSQDSVLRVAEMCGIKEFHHSKLPQDKLDFITNLQNQGKKVAFIGDGINDTLAISKANIGISLGCANDIAIKQADIILLNNNLENIFEAILLSKKTLCNIKENLAFAFVYNICGIPLALGIPQFFGSTLVLNPMIAGVAMGLSSISVVINALRLKKA